MTVWTQEADMPVVDLPGNAIIAFEAIDPTTGDPVTGVSVSNIAIFGNDLNLGGTIEFEPLGGDLETMILPQRG